MAILWRAAMAVGHDMIDTDHQQLIELINAVEDRLRGTVGDDSLAKTLDQLTLYAHEHFEREENLMRSLQYRRSVEHRQAHRELRTRLEKLRSDIEAANADTTPPAEIERLVVLLRSWLLDHVLKEDMLLKPVLHGPV